MASVGHLPRQAFRNPAPHIAAKWAANIAAMCSAPNADSLCSDPPARASRCRARRSPRSAASVWHVPCDRSVYTPPPRAGNRTVFMRSFVEDSSHATGNHRFAEPVASHKNEFCLLRPPGARPALLALRLINTPNPRNLCGGRVGRLSGSRARHIAALRGLRFKRLATTKTRQPSRPRGEAARGHAGCEPARRGCGHF